METQLKCSKELALVALHCLVFHEWGFSHGFLNQLVHSLQKGRQGSGHWEPCPCELLKKISWISKTRQLPELKRLCGDSRLLEKNLVVESLEPMLTFVNRKPSWPLLLWPLNCVGMEREGQHHQWGQALGLSHVWCCSVLLALCSHFSSFDPELSVSASRKTLGVLTEESEMSEGIESQRRYRNPGFFLVGQRTEPNLCYPPIFFQVAVSICYNVHFSNCLEWWFCSVSTYRTSKMKKMEKVLQRSIRLLWLFWFESGQEHQLLWWVWFASLSFPVNAPVNVGLMLARTPAHPLELFTHFLLSGKD